MSKTYPDEAEPQLNLEYEDMLAQEGETISDLSNLAELFEVDHDFEQREPVNAYELAKEVLSSYDLRKYDSKEAERLTHVKFLRDNLRKLGFNVITLRNILNDDDKLEVFLDDPKRGKLIRTSIDHYNKIKGIESLDDYKQLRMYKSLLSAFDISVDEAYLQLVKLLSEKDGLIVDKQYTFDIFLERLNLYGEGKRAVEQFTEIPDAPFTPIKSAKDYHDELVNSMLADESVSIEELIAESGGFTSLPWRPTRYGFRVPDQFSPGLVDSIYAQALNSVPVCGTNPEKGVIEEAQRLVKYYLSSSDNL